MFTSSGPHRPHLSQLCFAWSAHWCGLYVDWSVSRFVRRIYWLEGVLATTQVAYRKALAPFRVCLKFTEYIGEWAGGQDSADRLQCHFWQGQQSGNSLQTLFYGHWKFCAVCCNTVLSSRLQYVVLNGCRSNLVNVVPWLPQRSILGLCFSSSTPRSCY